MVKTAVLSVIYPAARPYLSEFLSSLLTQTNKDFALFLVNDGLKELDVLLKNIDLNVQVLEKKGLPAKLRKDGIEWVIAQGVERIIFADADDYFASNRVEISQKFLVDWDIVSNELLLVGEGIKRPISMLAGFLKEGRTITKEDVASANCLGLSNTAVRAAIVAKYFQSVPDTIIAFDWALFSQCIHGGARAVFTAQTETYYRQHSSNTASPVGLSVQEIMRGVDVKRDHYRLLSKTYKEYVSSAHLFEDLSITLRSDEQSRQNYCRAVQKHAGKMSLWWEPIKSLEELGL